MNKEHTDNDYLNYSLPQLSLKPAAVADTGQIAQLIVNVDADRQQKLSYYRTGSTTEGSSHIHQIRPVLLSLVG